MPALLRKCLPVNLCFCTGGVPERHISRQMRFKEERDTGEQYFFFLHMARNQRCNFLIGLGQEQEFLPRYQTVWGWESKHKGLAYVWEANSSLALNNVKITTTKCIFKGSECEDINKGKGDYLKWKILPCLFLNHRIIIFFFFFCSRKS